MAEPAEARNAWLKRVLGIVAPDAGIGATEEETRVSFVAAREAYEAASDLVNQQIAALQSALRQSSDVELQEIAEFGMNGVTGNHRVPLRAALMEIDFGGGGALAKSGPKALKIIQSFRAHLAEDERVEACDENPFGVTVSIRATLGGALAKMEQALQHAA
jgi:hypothetical protein